MVEQFLSLFNRFTYLAIARVDNVDDDDDESPVESTSVLLDFLVPVKIMHHAKFNFGSGSLCIHGLLKLLSQVRCVTLN